MKYTLKHTATLLETVMEMYKGISRQKAKQLIGHAEFILNGKKINRHPNLMIESGNILEMIMTEKGKIINRIPDKRNPVAIYYEDAHVLIALKPAGILSCGTREQVINNSFHKLLELYLKERDNKKTRLWIIHRLDREVEGLIVYAKSEEIQQEMKNKWSEVTKKYLALTENKPEPPDGIIENWLKDTPAQKVIASNSQIPGSQYAKTEYTYLRAEKPYHLLEVTLHTGRKNQIRVHLSGIGCPIAGDRKYGADASVVRQIRLAAYKLEFNHPVTNKTIAIHYMPPKRFFKPSETEDEKYKIV